MTRPWRWGRGPTGRDPSAQANGLGLHAQTSCGLKGRDKRRGLDHRGHIDYHFRGNTTHNVAVLGVCEIDGTIHLAFDRLNESLR